MNRNEFLALIDVMAPPDDGVYPTLDDYQRALDEIHARERAERKAREEASARFPLRAVSAGAVSVNSFGSVRSIPRDAYVGVATTHALSVVSLGSIGAVNSLCLGAQFNGEHGRAQVHLQRCPLCDLDAWDVSSGFCRNCRTTIRLAIGPNSFIAY